MTAGRRALLMAMLLCTGACLALPASGADTAAAASPRYVLDPAKSTLEFTFLQAGAHNKGRFTRFPLSFDFSPASAAGRLEVTVEMGSLDTGDHERDDTLRSADLFNVAKFPQAHFLATQFNKTTAGFEALGKLTIRGVTRDTRHLPHRHRKRCRRELHERKDNTAPPGFRRRPGRLEGHRPGRQRRRGVLRAAPHGRGGALNRPAIVLSARSASARSGTAVSSLNP